VTNRRVPRGIGVDILRPEKAVHEDHVNTWAAQKRAAPAAERFCRSNNLEPSMSRRGNCWDNAVAETFFSRLKQERIKQHIYKNRELAVNDISDYIESFDDRTRRIAIWVA
jgi:transposase InsO family protein